MKCSFCDGVGKLANAGENSPERAIVTCPRCNGTGRVQPDEGPAPGSGGGTGQ